MSARRAEQALVVLVGAALWSIAPHASLWSLAAAYALGWTVVNAVKALRPRMLRTPLTRPQALALAALVAIPAAAQAFRHFDDAIEHEELEGLDHLIGARMRVHRSPAIAPPLIAADRPQTFYVHAPGASDVAVRFGDAGARIEARALGHGLFRVEYDPRAHGLPDPPDGPLDASILVDGEAHGRSMLAVQPLPHPRWLAPSPDRALAVAVSEETDQLFVIGERGFVRTVATDDGPSDARFVSARIVAVAHRYASTLAFVDVETGRVRRRVEVGPLGHRLAVDDALIALAQRGETPSITILDRGGERLAEIQLDYAPDQLAFGVDALIVSSVRPPALHRLERTDGGWREVEPPLPLGRPAVTVRASADRERLIVAVTDLQTEGPPHLGNHFVQDQLLTVDLASWSIIDQRLTARRTPRQESPGSVDRGVSPMGIDALEGGALLVAFAGTDDVWRIEPGAASPAIIPIPDALAAPFSAVRLEDGFAVSSPSQGAIGLFSRGGRLRRLIQLAPSDRALLSEDERALQRRIGERTFYESTESGISCQSCHLHGGSDGGKHNIGGRALLGTLDTRGLLGTAPFLRDGDYPRLGAFADLADALFRGYRRDQGGRRIGLERYLEALPRPIPPRQLEGRDQARERRGLDVFIEARCPLCHAPPAFTNLGQHPADAIFPNRDREGYVLDTPSLLNVGESAPYLADGRAETLEAVFREHDPAGRHGDTRELDRRALGDLVYFLEGL